MLELNCPICHKVMTRQSDDDDEYYECFHKIDNIVFSYSMWCNVTTNIFGDSLRIKNVRIARYVKNIHDDFAFQINVSKYIDGIYLGLQKIKLSKQLDLYELAKLHPKDLLDKINRLMLLS